MNPDADPHQHKDDSLNPKRQAGLVHGLGLFLVVLGAWWLLGDLRLLPDVSFGAVAALVGGIWLLRRHKRRTIAKNP